MNPVLLKPSSETGSQVIVMGKPVSNMDVDQYIRYKPDAFRAAKDAFDSLASEHDAIVMEGAGSPAEINLKHHDIVNMNMALYANSPVLVVGDIDRGGVFASFVGTMELLTEQERKLVAGFIINRFRGDSNLLADAIAYTERHTGRPTFGVIPYLHNLGLPEEDSVTFKSHQREDFRSQNEAVNIVLVDLPHISNFTDFDALRLEPDVRLKIVRAESELGNPDAVIIPGSKNVIGDMEHLKRSGLAARLVELAENGRTEIIGICGGFQMLGREIADPHGLESGGKTTAGLGLMPITTILAMEKTLERISARHADSGLTVHGYEIHHGQTESHDLPHAVVSEEGRAIGIRSGNGMLWGTYMHGIFDADDFRRWFIDKLRERCSLSPLGRVVASYNLEPAFDRLADIVRGNLDVGKIYRLMGLK
jgi:cobyric acid synthase CobQ